MVGRLSSAGAGVGTTVAEVPVLTIDSVLRTEITNAVRTVQVTVAGRPLHLVLGSETAVELALALLQTAPDAEERYGLEASSARLEESDEGHTLVCFSFGAQAELALLLAGPAQAALSRLMPNQTPVQ